MEYSYLSSSNRFDDDASRVSSLLVDLPVGESNPRVRLARISYAMRALTQSSQSVGAGYGANGTTNSSSLSALLVDFQS